MVMLRVGAVNAATSYHHAKELATKQSSLHVFMGMSLTLLYAVCLMITGGVIGHNTVYNSVIPVTSECGGFHKRWLGLRATS